MASWIKNLIILLTCVTIYCYLNISGLIFILTSIITTYIISLILKNKKSKILLTIGILINLIILLSFKTIILYKSIVVPLGISYYTLQVIAYLVDIYKNKYEPCLNIINFSLYIFYIPCLFIGPINRYNDIEKELFNSKIKINNLYNGLCRICFGLFKKLVIASRISIIINSIVQNNYMGSYILFSCLLYTLFLYTDFSGGIDIVLGISKMLGITLKENFDRPLFSESIKQFWNRWHIALSSFLKDYVYIPLKGNRCSKIRQKINIMITFLVSGLWHGFNYLIWGLGQGILVILNIKTSSKILNVILTYVLVSLLWVFFIYPNNMEAIFKLTSIFTNFNLGSLFSNFLNLGLSISNYLVLIIATITLFIIEKKGPYLKISNNKKLILIGTLILIVLVFGVYGIGFQVEQFVYSKF